MNIGQGEQTIWNLWRHSASCCSNGQSTKVPQLSITYSQTFFLPIKYLHLTLTFLSMWNLHNKFVHFGNTVFSAFINARSMSVTITTGRWSFLKNKSRNYSKAHTILVTHSPSRYANPAKNVIPVGVTPTKSSSGSLYLFVL